MIRTNTMELRFNHVNGLNACRPRLWYIEELLHTRMSFNNASRNSCEMMKSLRDSDGSERFAVVRCGKWCRNTLFALLNALSSSPFELSSFHQKGLVQANADSRTQGRPYFTLSLSLVIFRGSQNARSPQLSAIKCKFNVSVYNSEISKDRLLRLGEHQM